MLWAYFQLKVIQSSECIHLYNYDAFPTYIVLLTFHKGAASQALCSNSPRVLMCAHTRIEELWPLAHTPADRHGLSHMQTNSQVLGFLTRVSTRSDSQRVCVKKDRWNAAVCRPPDTAAWLRFENSTPEGSGDGLRKCLKLGLVSFFSPHFHWRFICFLYHLIMCSLTYKMHSQ